MYLRRICAAFIVSCVVFGLAGCAQVRNNISNFGYDLLDIARVDVSFSLGTDMGAHVMATKLMQLKSYSYEDLYRFGWGTRMIGLWEEDREDCWIGPKSCYRRYNYHFKSVFALSPGLLDKCRDLRNYTGETKDEVGAGIHLFVIGARVGVRPLEIVDAVTTLFGWDICHDGVTRSMRLAMRRVKKLQNDVGAKMGQVSAMRKTYETQPTQELYARIEALQAQVLIEMERLRADMQRVFGKCDIKIEPFPPLAEPPQQQQDEGR